MKTGWKKDYSEVSFYQILGHNAALCVFISILKFSESNSKYSVLLCPTLFLYLRKLNTR